MRKSLFGLLFLVAAGVAAPAQAFDSDWRVKGGMLSVEDDDSAAVQAGLVWALDFVGIAGVEFEYNTSITDGEAMGVDYSASQLGGYATLTTPGPIYFKAKAGMVSTDIDVPFVGGSDTNPAYGIGAGFFGFEVEYTRTEWEESSIDFLSVSYGF